MLETNKQTPSNNHLKEAVDFVFVDTNYTAKALQFTEAGALTNGVLFGLMRSILTWQKRFPNAKIVWCFDSPWTYRRRLLANYKGSRRDGAGLVLNSTEQAKREAKRRLNQDLYRQLDEFKGVLADLGLRFEAQEGYEADDLIAVWCNGLAKQVVIASTDKDYYQLLNHWCSLFNPLTKKSYTSKDFMAEYGISSEHWGRVLAITGCSTDDVPGIDGVGPKTAIKFLQGKASSKQNTLIRDNFEMIERNLKLTVLPWCDPYPMMKESILEEHQIDGNKWDQVCCVCGMNSLIGLVK